jgi:cyclic pyranopterin phosphate synthase
MVTQMLTTCAFLTQSSVSQGFARAFTTTSLHPPDSNSGLSHVNDKNQPTMVDVSHKQATQREATARCVVWLPSTVARLWTEQGREISSPKGPVVATAIIAGTMAVKKTSDLIPFCHPLPIDSIKFNIDLERAKSESNEEDGSAQLIIECTVRVFHKTGVEMEALTGCSVAALAVYDMCKALSHDLVIQQVKLVEKKGGKSDYNNKSTT